jgi:CHAT domain-containing protein
MRSADEHLTPQEIDQLLFGADDSKDNAGGGAAPEAQQHLSGCAVCQLVADKYRNVDSALKGLSSGNKGLRNPDVGDKLSADQGRSEGPKRGRDCPAEETWPNLAVGLISDKEAARYVAHAAQCDWCGPLLKESMEDLAQDVTAEEQEALAKLPSASPGWQRAMAQKMAAESADVPLVEVETPARSKEPKSKGKARFGWWPKLVWAGSGLAVVVVAVWLGLILTRQPDVNQLLAQASIGTDQRVIELRMPGAPYGPRPSAERGTRKRDLPASFDTALGIIKRKLSEHPQDPYWLQARARASLLEGDYEAAKTSLDYALQLKPDDSSLLLDRATALFEQAENEQANGGQAGFGYYGEAAQDLGKILTPDPHNRVALFNRAIIYDKLGMQGKAIQDLNEFLHQEPDGPWAVEVHHRLDDLIKRQQKHDQSRAEPLLPAGEFARASANPVVLMRIDNRIEDYQDEAIAKWLPSAFPAIGSGDHDALAALYALAGVLALRHKDRWLGDFLAAANHSPVFVSAALALHNAVDHSAHGEWDAESAEALKAGKLFSQAGNLPGELRAAAEAVHALRGEQQGKKCLQQAEPMEAKLKNLDYRWLDAQIQIDECSCAVMGGNFDRAERYVNAAEKITWEAAYPTLRLRALGIAASADTVAGRVAAAWAKNVQGIRQYWEGTAPPLRVQQFYDDLTVSAEELQQWNLAAALEEESARAVSLTADRETEAMVRRHLVKLAILAGDFDLSRKELRRADDLLVGLSYQQSLAGHTYSEIDRAQIDVQQGNLAQAEQRLNGVKANLRQLSSFEIQLNFDSTYAGLLERKGKDSQAASYLYDALKLIDSNAGKLSSMRDRYLWNLEVSELYRSFVGLEMEHGNTSQALEVWEWYRAAQLPRLSQPLNEFNPFFGTRRVSEIVPKDGSRVVISYAALPQGVAIWVLNDQRIEGTSFLRGKTADVMRSSGSLTALCMNPGSDLSQLKKEAQQLYAQLIAPVAAHIAATSSLAIEADEQLGDLPFEVLLAPDGRYLAESHSITYSPGLLYGIYLREAGSFSSQSRGVAVGSTALSSNPDWALDPIPEVVPEAREVAGKFQGVPLTDREASVPRLEMLLPRSEIVHLAAHGIVTNENEGLLLFAEKGQDSSAHDTVLWGADRMRPEFFRRARLVVLSACSINKSTKNRLEVRGRLVRAILGARVPNVVAARWNVNSTLTVGFMDEFYSQLIHGSSVSSALASAEEQVRTKLHKEHPYYWAAFAVIGRG